MAALIPISLPDLQRDAGFLTRFDRKYVVPVSALPTLIDSIHAPLSILEINGLREFWYTSAYFDDDTLTAYRRAAERRPNRYKVRTRRYDESGCRYLELKVRDPRGQTIKTRTDHLGDRLDALSCQDRLWLSGAAPVAASAGRLHHCVTTRYRRTTLALPVGMGRVTIDQEVTFALPSGEAVTIPSLTIVETKGPGSPTAMDHALWRHGYRPERISKFTVGLSLLVPDLPANHWHRTKTRLERISVPATLPPDHGTATAAAIDPSQSRLS